MPEELEGLSLPTLLDHKGQPCWNSSYHPLSNVKDLALALLVMLMGSNAERLMSTLATMAALTTLLLLVITTTVASLNLSILMLSKTCSLAINTSFVITQSSHLRQHSFELDCVRTSYEFHQRKAQHNYSFFLGDALETACLDASQGVVPLASAISQSKCVQHTNHRSDFHASPLCHLRVLQSPRRLISLISICCHADVARKSLAASIWIPVAAGNVSLSDVTGVRLAVSSDMMNEVLWLWAIFAKQGFTIGETTSQVS